LLVASGGEQVGWSANRPHSCGGQPHHLMPHVPTDHFLSNHRGSLCGADNKSPLGAPPTRPSGGVAGFGRAQGAAGGMHCRGRGSRPLPANPRTQMFKSLMRVSQLAAEWHSIAKGIATSMHP